MDKKISLYKHIRKKPALWQSCILMDLNNFNNLGRLSPKKHVCHVIFKIHLYFWSRRLLKLFLFINIRKTRHSLTAICLADQNNLTNLGRRASKEHLCQIIFKLGFYFWTRRFLKFLLYTILGNIWPWFLTDQNHLNNLGRGSPKEHLCQIILKSCKHFSTRLLKKFPFSDAVKYQSEIILKLFCWFKTKW